MISENLFPLQRRIFAKETINNGSYIWEAKSLTKSRRKRFPTEISRKSADDSAGKSREPSIVPPHFPYLYLYIKIHNIKHRRKESIYISLVGHSSSLCCIIKLSFFFFVLHH